MATTESRRFETFQSWHSFIEEVREKKLTITGSYLAELRQECYKRIEQYFGDNRKVLLYATKFVTPIPGAPVSIDLSDVDGFTDLTKSVDISYNKIALVLHSPGGSPEVTDRIVKILRNRFSDILFLIPHSAYSAATMLALSGNEIIVHPSATLGPIDPQITFPTKEGMRTAPARSILDGFEKARERIRKIGPSELPVYIPLIEKYSLDLFEYCERSEELAKDLVIDWLKQYMLSNDIDNSAKKNKKAKNIAEYVSSYKIHKMHSKALKIKELQKKGVKINITTDSLKDFLWEINILIQGFFDITPMVKLYENTSGISYGKNHIIIK